MGIFDSLIGVASQAGIFAFYLPFLITFALLYGLLSRIGIFGQSNRMTNALNAIIAFSIALFVIGFTPAGVTLGKFFGTFFSQTTIVLVTFIIGMVVLVLLGQTLGPVISVTKEGDIKERGFVFGKYVALVLVLVVVGVFVNSGGLQALGISNTAVILPGISMQDLLIIGFILLTAAIVVWVSAEKKD